MPRTKSRSQFVSDKLSDALNTSGFWNTTCTVRVVSDHDRDNFGEPNPVMETLYGDVPCRTAVQTTSGSGANVESEGDAGTITKLLRVVTLDGYYPLITEDADVVLAGEAEPYDIENVQHSSDHSFTRIFLQQIAGRGGDDG